MPANDALDPGPQESPDASFTEEALHRVRTHDGLNSLHRVPRDLEAQRGVMPKEPHPLVVRQLMVGDDLYTGPQERGRRESEEGRPGGIDMLNGHRTTFSCEVARRSR
jgi:hypothetical protein